MENNRAIKTMLRSILKLSFWGGYRVPIENIQSIDVEPIAACNLKCPFCQVATWNRSHNTKAMSPDFFEKVINQIPNLKKVKLQGMGEPFLNPDLTEMIKIGHKHNIETWVITNGVLLNDHLIKEILDSNLTELEISFDSARKEIYEKLRTGANYETVVKNIISLCEFKRQRNSKIKIGIISLVINSKMLGEIPLLTPIFAEQFDIRISSALYKAR